MSDEVTTPPKAPEEYQPLLSARNISLVTLPWLRLQKDVLKKVRAVNDDIHGHNPVGRLVNTAIASQLGLVTALRGRPVGKRLGEFLASGSEKKVEPLTKISTLTERIAANSSQLIQSYEVVLDAAISEMAKNVEDKSDDGAAADKTEAT